MKPNTILKELRTTNKHLESMKGKLSNIHFEMKTLNKKHTRNTNWTTIAGICGILALCIALLSILIATNTIFIGEDTSATKAELVQKPLEEKSKGATSFYINSYLVSSQIREVEPNSPKTSKEFIIQKMAEQITECESQNRHLDRNGNLLVGDKHLKNPAFGIAQYQKRTFSYLSNLANRPDLRIENKQHQIWLLKWSLRNNLGHYWSCYKPYIEVKIN